MAVLLYSFSTGKRFARSKSNVMQKFNFFNSSLLLRKSTKDSLYLGLVQIAQGSYKQKHLCEHYSNCSRHHSTSSKLERYRAISGCNHAYRLPYVSGAVMKISLNSPFFKHPVGKYFDFVARPIKELTLLSPSKYNNGGAELVSNNKPSGNHVKYLHRMAFLGPFYMNGIKANKNFINNKEECFNNILQSRQKSSSGNNRDKPKKPIKGKESIKTSDESKKELLKKKLLVNSKLLKNKTTERKPTKKMLSLKDQDILLTKLLNRNSFTDLDFASSPSISTKEKDPVCKIKKIKEQNISSSSDNSGKEQNDQDIAQTEEISSISLNELYFDPIQAYVGKIPQVQKIDEAKQTHNLSKLDIDPMAGSSGTQQNETKQTPSISKLDVDPMAGNNFQKGKEVNQTQQQEISSNKVNVCPKTGNTFKQPMDEEIDQIPNVSLNELDLDLKLKRKRSVAPKDQNISDKSQEILDDLDCILKSHGKQQLSQELDNLPKRERVSYLSSPADRKDKLRIMSSYESLMGNINQAVLEDFKKLPYPNNQIQATYVWVVGNCLGVKERVLLEPPQSVEDLPEWSGCNLHKQTFTLEEVEFSLMPKQYYNNPFKPNNGNVLVLCDTYNFNDKPLSINKRAACLTVISKVKELDPWFGFSQEYVILNKTGKSFGNSTVEVNLARELAEAHASACLYAGICFYGVNLLPIPGKWEYQVGPGRGLDAADDLWISRYILKRIAEKMGLQVSFNLKRVSRVNLHTRVTFSTAAMRGEDGITAIKKAIYNLEKNHEKDSKIYNYKQTNFSLALGAKNATIRVPLIVVRNGFGYMEDCRPDANSDPYDIVKTTLNTCLEEYFKPVISKEKRSNSMDTKPSNSKMILVD